VDSPKWNLNPNRYFDVNPAQRELARQLYEGVSKLPLVCPHTHVPPAWLSDPQARLGSPADLLIIPDHYVFRLLYSQGISLESLGVPSEDGSPVETDHRKIWQRFAENFYLFRGTPTGGWFADVLINLFGIEEKLDRENAQRIYDQIDEKLKSPEFAPRALFKRFNIEILSTTDSPCDSLEEHKALQAEGYKNILPTFRPDEVVNLEAPGWADSVKRLSQVSGIDIVSYATYMQAFEQRRAYFKKMGATATDQGAMSAYTAQLSHREAEDIFGRALQGRLEPEDATLFTAHMFMEMARMSVEDGLVMQMHIGSYRNYNPAVFARFGANKGADIPLQIEWTRNLQNLLNAYGNDSRLRLILFGLDESTYSRELAPLAGHYPAVLLGPPWWFHDSVNGMNRYLDQVIETASLYNTAGFNDDTRAFASIPARHDVWRRVTCNWLAGLTLKGFIDEADAYEMALDCAYRLAKRAYNL
jgi:glucuronate isomerase